MYHNIKITLNELDSVLTSLKFEGKNSDDVILYFNKKAEVLLIFPFVPKGEYISNLHLEHQMLILEQKGIIKDRKDFYKKILSHQKQKESALEPA